MAAAIVLPLLLLLAAGFRFRDVDSFLRDPPLIFGARFHDNFNAKADGPIDGQWAQTGQIYHAAGNLQWFSGGELVSFAGRGGAQKKNRAAITYADLGFIPSKLALEFAFTKGEVRIECNLTGQPHRLSCPQASQNAVIGVTPDKGFGRGSVQLAIFEDNWLLFAVENPIVDPYYTIASGHFEQRLEPDRRYVMRLQFDAATSTALVTLPDGSRHRVTDPIMNRYWGDKIGIQMRRGDERSGEVVFSRVAAN